MMPSTMARTFGSLEIVNGQAEKQIVYLRYIEVEFIGIFKNDQNFLQGNLIHYRELPNLILLWKEHY